MRDPVESEGTQLWPTLWPPGLLCPWDSPWLLCPSPGDLSNPGIGTQVNESPALQADSTSSEP